MQGLAFFPGVNQVISASYTLAHGITPGVATLEMAPQPGYIGVGGTLSFQFDQVTLAFPGCKVDSATVEGTGGGYVWRLAILDRRWRWAFGAISGSYNLRHVNGKLVKDGTSPGTQLVWETEKTPQELAALCLVAMGEGLFSVGDLPNDARPTIEWDHEVPAQALAQLCDDLGCRVVLQLDGTVAIRRTGLGQALPSLPAIIERSLAIDPPEQPDALVVVGSRIRHEVDLPLEAVGKDLDGQIKPIDSLSYKPSVTTHPNGWSDCDLEGFTNLADTKVIELAKETVFKWYRVKTPFTVNTYDSATGTFAGLNVLDLAEVALEDTMVQTSTQDGLDVPRPAEVFGSWYDGQLTYQNVAADLKAIGSYASGGYLSDYAKEALYRRGFAIDSENGLVKFSERLTRLDSNNRHGAANVVLRTSVLLRDKLTRAWRRFERKLIGGTAFGTPSRNYLHDDLVFTVRTLYDTTAVASSGAYVPAIGLDSNLTQAIIDADALLAGAANQYQLTTPEVATYAGLVPVNPDGAIQQASWSLGPSGTVTRIARNNEVSLGNVPYKERRFYERVAVSARATGKKRWPPERRSQGKPERLF